MRRRDFVGLVGGAAAWPLAAGAQQQTMPVVGYLYSGSPETSTVYLAAFRQGLSQAGFIEGRNVAIEFRFAHNEFDRLPELAADLVRRRVAVIASPGSLAAPLAAKAATATIPIVFHTGADPVQSGLVASLNRPGGNLTGVASMNVEIVAKRLSLLHELVLGVALLAMIADPSAPGTPQGVANVEAAAHAMGRQIVILYASANREIDGAFARLVQQRAAGVVVNSNPLFGNRRVQVVGLAAHHRIPAIYFTREFVDVGGLMSYGANLADMFRLVGLYAGRVLKGEKPSDLPVMQPTKFEFVINLQTARTLGIEVPPTLLAIADEVIE